MEGSDAIEGEFAGGSLANVIRGVPDRTYVGCCGHSVSSRQPTWLRRQPLAESLHPDREPTAWSDALDRLDGGGRYWLATVRPDGRPHLVPVLAVWVGGTVHFCAGPGTGKVRNLTHSPHCAISVGGDGLDLVVEGQAVRATDEQTVRAVAEAYASTLGEVEGPGRPAGGRTGGVRHEAGCECRRVVGVEGGHEVVGTVHRPPGADGVP